MKLNRVAALDDLGAAGAADDDDIGHVEEQAVLNDMADVVDVTPDMRNDRPTNRLA